MLHFKIRMTILIRAAGQVLRAITKGARQAFLWQRLMLAPFDMRGGFWQTVLPNLPREKCLSIILALTLLVVRMGRASGEENQVGYRHEFYREDEDRMSIDTDSLLLDIGLASHVRVKGTYVIDTISGATPMGAPPQKQWPFATYGDFTAGPTPRLMNRSTTSSSARIRFTWTRDMKRISK